jgi:hypothetical protein
MGVQVSLHCDNEDCTTWAVEGPLTEDWLVLHPGAGMETQVFCDGWCLLRTVAKWAEPPMIVQERPDL